MTSPFETWQREQLSAIDAALTRWITPAGNAQLGAAMAYAVQGGGKRIRPVLTLATAHALGGDAAAALRAACALECIHAYSLVHDDMPCMDNDTLRRGKPTVHVAYGEAVALLVGDALQSLAFELITPTDGSIAPAMQAHLCSLLARASGQSGMCGGQAIDLLSVGKKLTQAELENMHALKTGALLEASVMMGAACAPSVSTAAQTGLQRYAARIGLAFQVVDDVLDCTSDTATLGKTAGKDAEADKPTYVALLGLTGAQDYARALHREALEGLAATALPDTDYLRAIANAVVERVH